MNGFAEYDQYDGLGLAELVRSKQVSPTELVEEAIRRIEQHNPKLNAVVYKTRDRQLRVLYQKALFKAYPSWLRT